MFESGGSHGGLKKCLQLHIPSALPPWNPALLSTVPSPSSRLRFCPLFSAISNPLSPHSLSSSSSSSSSEDHLRPFSEIQPFLGMERFWTDGLIDRNKAMVEYLKQHGIIKSREVAEVMEAIDRGLFVPAGCPPYVDRPVQIGYNATISAPHMHASCLELLEKQLLPGMSALDVGSGTGYLTACFALMVGPQGHVVGVEHIPELVTSSVENIKKSSAASLSKEGSLSIHVADGRLGWPELAPCDAIHVGAAAPEIPQPLIDQLKPGGRMVIPVGTVFQNLKVVDKKLDGSVSVRNEICVWYVPFTSRATQLHDY
ncbi:protein-L-isoaspartate O-methyltransferase isoform X1 [Elaeis guineensis]|uniref:protein-L-isoaspartate O-methyltransferase isoform X1 n=1 Tax=Elaeis guineensis var. tenera TaxID=51953 RepID=UPI003C6D577D